MEQASAMDPPRGPRGTSPLGYTWDRFLLSGGSRSGRLAARNGPLGVTSRQRTSGGRRAARADGTCVSGIAGSSQVVVVQSHAIAVTYIVYNLYTTVPLVMLMPMDTSTSSKGEGEPVFHSSKVV